MKIPPYGDFLPEVEALFELLESNNNPAITFTQGRFKGSDDANALKERIPHDKLIKIFEVCDDYARQDSDIILSDSASSRYYADVIGSIAAIIN